LQDRIDALEQQLNQKQIDYEDLLIRRNNLAAHLTQLMNQSHNVRTLILTREKFPPNFGQVFETHDYVFVVEFKGTEVLDISVMTQQQAHDQYKNEGVISGHG